MINDDIIERVLDNCASEKEAAEVAEFFATEEGQRRISGLMDAELRKLECGGEPLAEDFPAEEIYQSIMRTIRRRRTRRLVWQFAGALIPVAVVAGALALVNRNVAGGHLFEKNELVQISVPAGDRMKVIFHDGSAVCLNAGSTLTYPLKFGLASRNVSLEGEGYFEVAKNPQRPFKINIKDGDVKVYGTSFNLCSYNTDKVISLSLDSGSVEMSVGGSSYDIVPGQVLYYDRITGTARIVSGGNLFKSRWKEGIVTFKSTTLEDIAVSLSRMFAVDVRLSPDIDSTVLYTFTSSSRNLDELLDELCLIAPVAIEKEGNTVRLIAR